MNITYTDHISAEDYTKLRASVGWLAICPEQAEATLSGSRFVIAAKDGEHTVGMARIVSDGGYICFLADVIVLPEYQGKGIGNGIVSRLTAIVKDSMKSGYRINFVLLSAVGKEGFYERFGFTKRPNDQFGHGMQQWLEKE